MALFYVTLLTPWFLLCIGVQTQYKNKDRCIYQGDDDTYTFYQGGDVVLGGLFPFHFSPVSLVSSFRTKPKSTKYKLCVVFYISSYR